MKNTPILIFLLLTIGCNNSVEYDLEKIKELASKVNSRAMLLGDEGLGASLVSKEGSGN